MEALPLPVLADPAPEIDPRRVWATIARSAWLILGCVLLALAAGALAVRRMEPVYQSTASIRIDAKSGAASAAALYGLPTDNMTLVATAMEELTSRSLSNDVADSLGLRLAVAAPTRTPRSAVLAWAHVDSAAPLRSYRLTPFPGKQVAVQELGGRTLGRFPLAGTITVPGAAFRLAPTALAKEEVVLRVAPIEEASALVRSRMQVAQPNLNANIVTVTFEGNDPSMVRDVANVLASRFVKKRLEAEKAGARSTVVLLRRQLDTLGHEMISRELAVSRFLKANKIISVENEAAQRTAEIQRLQEARVTASTDRAALLASLDNLLKVRDTADGRLAYERLLSVPAFARQLNTSSPSSIAIERLRVQEDQRAALLRRLGPNDPDVQSVERQIATSKRDIEATTRTYADGLGEQVRALDTRIAALRADVQLLPDQQVQYQRLLREQKGVEDVMNQVQGRLKEAEITAAVQDSTAQVLDRAELPGGSLGTSKPVIFAVALFAGLLMGVLVAFLRDWLDTTVHNEQDVSALVRAPVIGIIPNLRVDALASRARSLMSGDAPARAIGTGKAAREGAGETQTMAAEAYRALRTNLSYVSPARPPRVIVVTSALSGDGKTTSASNLAVTLAQQNKRVLLIDAETRRGNMHTLFGIEATPGFFDLLYGQATPGECIRRVTLEGSGHLDVLPSGGMPSSNAADLLVASRLAPFFERLRMQYDYVLIDTPPLNLFTDAALIGAHADATLLVARADRTERQALKFAVLQLQHVQANLAGAILNGVDLRRNSRYRGGYDFGRYGAYYN
ncbi:MAG TPA: polysaccharide biosynthesis tyrosine autokinase [Gemmatimonadaceae bacterium]|jgi:capsular exopolysaccharide synthesis family protein|nr:polysaccharide biosynthesis tyrosine autokinase [Gemmatimonadaceae bacterium]